MKITKETIYRFITVTLKYIDRPKLTSLMDKYGNRRNAVDNVTVYNLFMSNKAFSREYLVLVRGLETRNPEFKRDLENGTIASVAQMNFADGEGGSWWQSLLGGLMSIGNSAVNFVDALKGGSASVAAETERTKQEQARTTTTIIIVIAVVAVIGIFTYLLLKKK